MVFIPEHEYGPLTDDDATPAANEEPCPNCCGAGYFGLDSDCRACGGTGRVNPRPDAAPGARGALTGPTGVWECKIGRAGNLPMGADLPMRDAIRKAFYELTGQHADFLFSGWGAELTEGQLAVVENRMPQSLPPDDSAEKDSRLEEQSKQHSIQQHGTDRCLCFDTGFQRGVESARSAPDSCAGHQQEIEHLRSAWHGAEAEVARLRGVLAETEKREQSVGLAYCRLAHPANLHGCRYSTIAENNALAAAEQEAARLKHLHDLDHSLANQFMERTEKAEQEAARLRGALDCDDVVPHYEKSKREPFACDDLCPHVTRRLGRVSFHSWLQGAQWMQARLRAALSGRGEEQ